MRTLQEPGVQQVLQSFEEKVRPMHNRRKVMVQNTRFAIVAFDSRQLPGINALFLRV
jgi:hypothetical protein